MELISFLNYKKKYTVTKAYEKINTLKKDEFFTTRYSKESGELVVKHDGELVGDNYEVGYYDHSNEINVYSNEIFEVEVN